MRIRFLRRTVYDTNGPGKGPVYAAGEVYDVRPDEAERWFRRGVAVEATPDPQPEPSPEPSPEPLPAQNEPPADGAALEPGVVTAEPADADPAPEPPPEGGKKTSRAGRTPARAPVSEPGNAGV